MVMFNSYVTNYQRVAIELVILGMVKMKLGLPWFTILQGYWVGISGVYHWGTMAGDM